MLQATDKKKLLLLQSLSSFLSFFLLCATATVRISHINARVLSWYNSRTADEHALKNHFQKFSLKSENKSFGYTRSDDALRRGFV